MQKHQAAQGEKAFFGILSLYCQFLYFLAKKRLKINFFDKNDYIFRIHYNKNKKNINFFHFFAFKSLTKCILSIRIERTITFFDVHR